LNYSDPSMPKNAHCGGEKGEKINKFTCPKPGMMWYVLCGMFYVVWGVRCSMMY
jgi:hypothetical protein